MQMETTQREASKEAVAASDGNCESCWPRCVMVPTVRDNGGQTDWPQMAAGG